MESIFDRDFYPTPAAVIERMLMGVEIFDKLVLEPSAGSGNIVDALNAQGVREVYACEINDRLRKTLSGKCTIIGKDFLAVTPDQISHIDVIVMNPPFSDAERHILCVNNSQIEWGKWAPMGKYIYHKDRDPEYIAGFFKIRGYKKGTMHFEFADEDVWAKFNIAVAKIKGWKLPKMRNYR